MAGLAATGLRGQPTSVQPPLDANRKVPALAQEVVAQAVGDRQKIVDVCLPALAPKPDAAHGKKVFAATMVSA